MATAGMCFCRGRQKHKTICLIVIVSYRILITSPYMSIMFVSAVFTDTSIRQKEYAYHLKSMTVCIISHGIILYHVVFNLNLHADRVCFCRFPIGDIKVCHRMV